VLLLEVLSAIVYVVLPPLVVVTVTTEVDVGAVAPIAVAIAVISAVTAVFVTAPNVELVVVGAVTAVPVVSTVSFVTDPVAVTLYVYVSTPFEFPM